MKAGFFFIIATALVAAVLIAGCTQQAELPKLPVQTQENVTECVADSDCGVGGCSGQVCATAEEAKGLITTCEYREEYGCLKLTSCGCVDGKCGWKNSSDYHECLKAAKLQQPQ